MISDQHLDRLLRLTADTDVLDALTERLSPSDAQSLLLEVMRRRAARVAPTRLLSEWSRNRFSRPSDIAPERLLSLDRLAFEQLRGRGFEPIELAPVVPLGTQFSSDQDRVVSAVRSLEVLADSTNALAVEAAHRRHGLLRSSPRSAEPIGLCASSRVVRAQRYADPNALAHFRLLGVVTAGRDTGSWEFERAALHEHIAALLAFLRSAGVSEVRVRLLDLTGGVRAGALAQVADELDVPVQLEEAAGNYYREARFRIDMAAADGTEFNIADGGLVPWTQQILGNRKERLMISGLGTELLATKFQRSHGPGDHAESTGDTP